MNVRMKVRVAAIVVVAAGAAGCGSHRAGSPGLLRPDEGEHTYAIHETSPTTPPTIEYLGRQRYSDEVNTIMNERWPVTRITMTINGELRGFTLAGTDPAIPTGASTHYWRSIVFGTDGRIVSAVPAEATWAGCVLKTITDDSTDPPTLTYECVPSQTDPYTSPSYCRTIRTWMPGFGWVWSCDCTNAN